MNNDQNASRHLLHIRKEFDYIRKQDNTSLLLDFEEEIIAISKKFEKLRP